MEIDAFIVVVAAVIVAFVVAFMAAKTGGKSQTSAGKTCASCSAENPGLARHCRRCGKLL